MLHNKLLSVVQAYLLVFSIEIMVSWKRFCLFCLFHGSLSITGCLVQLVYTEFPSGVMNEARTSCSLRSPGATRRTDGRPHHPTNWRYGPRSRRPFCSPCHPTSPSLFPRTTFLSGREGPPPSLLKRKGIVENSMGRVRRSSSKRGTVNVAHVPVRCVVRGEQAETKEAKGGGAAARGTDALMLVKKIIRQCPSCQRTQNEQTSEKACMQARHSWPTGVGATFRAPACSPGVHLALVYPDYFVKQHKRVPTLSRNKLRACCAGLLGNKDELERLPTRYTAKQPITA